MSPSSQRAWIEILLSLRCFRCLRVALLAEGVDRNLFFLVDAQIFGVALLAEGVDRNLHFVKVPWNGPLSPSSQRAWIEIVH